MFRLALFNADRMFVPADEYNTFQVFDFNEFDTVELCLLHYYNNINFNRYSLTTLVMPDPPTIIPTTKSSTRTNKLSLFDDACKLSSTFRWINKDSSWKRINSTVTIQTDKIPIGSKLAIAAQILQQASTIRNARWKLSDLTQLQKSSNERVESFGSFTPR